jgi:hypothetical protein
MAIYALRKVKMDQRQLMDNSSTITDMARTQNNVYEILSDVNSRQDIMDERIANLEDRLNSIQVSMDMLPDVLSRCIQSSLEHMSSATALVASSSSTAAIAVAAGSTGQQAAGHFRGPAPVLQPGQVPGQMGQLQPINAQQHQNTEDLLLTQNNVNNPAAVPIQQQQRPNWAVVTTSSTVSPIGGHHGILTPTTLGGIASNSATPSVALQPNSGNPGMNNVNPNQNWINSRPNSSSIHTPSPTNLAPLQPQLTSAIGGTLGQQQQHTIVAVRLPPPLAPITQATIQQAPSSLPPPAYTPPTHLSSSGQFQSSPHSSS